MMPSSLLGAAPIAFGPNVNAVFDGNSFVASLTASNPSHGLVAQTMGTTPIAGSGASSANLGIGGQTWADMIASASDVDSAFAPGSTNILLAMETTNSIWRQPAGSVQQTIADIANYIAGRKAAHPGWQIVLTGTIPRTDNTVGYDVADLNARMTAVDDYLRTNHRAMGASAFVDLRLPGSPYAFTDYSDASFTAHQAYYYETTPTKVHPPDIGYAFLGSTIAAVFAQLKRR